MLIPSKSLINCLFIVSSNILSNNSLEKISYRFFKNQEKNRKENKKILSNKKSRIVKFWIKSDEILDNVKFWIKSDEISKDHLMIKTLSEKRKTIEK